MIRILLVVAFAIMSSHSQACDDQMEQQTQIMQQQLFSQQRQEQEQEQRQADYRADINAQEQIRQERNNAGWTNAILLDGQAKRGW